MYDEVYKRMVEAGVAIKLDEEVMLDKDGSIVEDESQMFGRPTRYIVTMWLNQNKLFLLMNVVRVQTRTMMVMLVVNIFCWQMMGQRKVEWPVIQVTFTSQWCALPLGLVKSDKDIENLPFSAKVGIDVSKDMVTGATLYDIIESNHVEGGAMSGGPVSWVHGIEIPCFVCCLPKASITSELLVGMFAFIGELSTSYLSMILENKEKREGVKRKLEKTRGKNMTDAEKYAILKDHTNLTYSLQARGAQLCSASPERKGYGETTASK
jgi:hypothetical protein